VSSLDALLRSPRYEVFPSRGTEQAVADWVPAGMTVTVTASPLKGLDATIELAERLAREHTLGLAAHVEQHGDFLDARRDDV